MKKLGIIQPGKIGDIIICLPIAKWYADRGWKVIWPVDKIIIDNFIGYVDYVEFVSIEFDCIVAHQACFQNNCNRVIDLAFTIPGANIHNSDWYLNHNDTMSFDEMKYAIAEVPFEEKWNLKINRNAEKEQVLVRSLVGDNEQYVLLQEQSSDTFIRKTIDHPYNIVNIVPKDGFSVFDWLSVVENAYKCVLIASSFTNLIDQLYENREGLYVIMKPGYDGKNLEDGHLQGFPRLRNEWKEI